MVLYKGILMVALMLFIGLTQSSIYLAPDYSLLIRIYELTGLFATNIHSVDIYSPSCEHDKLSTILVPVVRHISL